MKTMSKRAASTRIPILGSRIPIPGQQLPPETVTTISTEITRKTLGKKVRYADKIGTLRFVGIVHFSAGVWCGIELSNAAGKNDGSVRGVRYFACPDGRGLMAPLSKVTAVDNEGNVDDEEGASGPHSMLFGISNQPNHNFPKTVRNTENVTTCDTNDQSFISDTRETTNLTKKLIRTNTFDVSDSTLGSSEADCTFSTSVDNKTVRCANETFTKLTYLNENHYTDETLDEGRNDPLSDVQRKDDISFNSDALTSSTNNDDQSLRDDLFSLSNRRRSILAGNINIRSNDTFNTKDGRNCRAEPPFNLKESEIKEPKLQLDVFVSVPNYSTPYSDVESSPRRRAKAAPVSLNFATDEEGNKRDSLEFEESLGILTPEQMIDGTGFIVSRTPSSENIGSLPNDFVNVKTDVKVELVSTPNPSVIEYSLGIIDENVLSSFSIETDHTMNIDLILDKSKERVIARIEQTPSPEELPLDPIPLSEPKSATTKSKTNSFITSITSITSLDTGYQGDGEMSRPASRGADHSPLTRRPIPRPAPRRPDPMTDSDFYTESDADNHEDHPLRGDRKAQVIDGTLYGVDPQAAADIYVNNRENMDSSGIFTDIDANTRTDELSSSVENANQANEAMDVSPTPSDSTTKTISENSQNHAVLILSKGLNSFDATKTTTDSKSSESNSKRKSLSSVASSPTSMRSPKHDPKDDSTKKHKTQKRSVSAQVKTVETKAKTETKKLPLKKPAGRWDAVMNKISKTPCEPNLKDIKSKVFSSIPASAARQSASQKPQSTKTRRSRTRAASNATPTKHAESVHSSLSDLSGASPAKKNNDAYSDEFGEEQLNIRRINGNLGPRDELKDAVYIKISSEYVPVLYKNSVKDLLSLTHLVLDEDGIQDIKPGAFKNLPMIDYINLEANKLQTIREGVFNHLTLSELDIGGNNISSIDRGAFDNMPKLIIITLDNNKIKEWNSDWFDNCPKLYRISAQDNLITSLPARAFKNIKPDGSRLTPDIMFNRNKISHIDLQAFLGLNEIGWLVLEGNQLVELDENLFATVVNIDWLDLDGNNLTCIPLNLLKVFKRFSDIDLTTNPLHSGCKKSLRAKFSQL